MRVDTDVLTVLDRAVTDGTDLRLPDQLNRALYVRTNKVLEAAGGKWSRPNRAHVFDGAADDAIEQVLLTGEVTTPQDVGFFPSPQAVVDRLVRLAQLDAASVALEPSAGEGAIAASVAKVCPVDCVELLAEKAAAIAQAGYARTLTVADFLAMEPAATYDRVLMNPPFARQADIAHVRHALCFLKPGGLLVSVMSNGVVFRANRTASDFRALVASRGGQLQTLPEDSFKASGTSVRTIIAVVPS